MTQFERHLDQEPVLKVLASLYPQTEKLSYTTPASTGWRDAINEHFIPPYGNVFLRSVALGISSDKLKRANIYAWLQSLVEYRVDPREVSSKWVELRRSFSQVELSTVKTMQTFQIDIFERLKEISEQFFVPIQERLRGSEVPQGQGWVFSQAITDYIKFVDSFADVFEPSKFHKHNERRIVKGLCLVLKNSDNPAKDFDEFIEVVRALVSQGVLREESLKYENHDLVRLIRIRLELCHHKLRETIKQNLIFLGFPEEWFA
ncbi:MAG: hypothetical protein N2654_01275 [Deltaproteobacteria bacterium]|nr:hypothetical protein [Deltaproteobacteria bacterium]